MCVCVSVFVRRARACMRALCMYMYVCCVFVCVVYVHVYCVSACVLCIIRTLMLPRFTTSLLNDPLDD